MGAGGYFVATKPTTQRQGMVLCGAFCVAMTASGKEPLHLRRRGLGVRISCWLVWAAWFGVAGSVGAEAHREFRPEGEPGRLFREFLAQTPWIKYASFRRSLSRDRMLVGSAPDKPVTEMPRLFLLERFEAAWQPEGWYKRSFETEKGRPKAYGDGKWRFEPVPAGLEVVHGCNRYYQWALFADHRRLNLTFRTNTPGGQGEHHERIVVFDGLHLVNFRLGLDPLGGGPLQWLNDHEFVVGPPPIWKELGGRGRITRWDEHGRPVELVFEPRRWAGRTTNFFRVTYFYLPERPFPPWQYVVEEWDPPRKWLRHTNFLDEIEFGLDPSAPEGYFPEMFRKRPEPLEMITATSNNVMYVVHADGRWEPSPGADLPDVPLPGPESWRTWQRGVVLAVFIVGMGLVVWSTRKLWWSQGVNR